MAKKRGRRPSQAARRTSVSERAPRPAATPSAAATVKRAVDVAPQAVEKGSAGKAPDFASEYRYVLGDLKRIAILAAGMFTTLGVLALIIR